MSEKYFEYQKLIIASNVKWERKKLGLNQENLSKSVRINYRYYQDVETAKNNLTIETIVKLCGAFNMAPSDLMSLKRLHVDCEDVDEFIETNSEKIENIDMPVGIRSLESKVVFHNKHFSSMMGTPEKSWVGKDISDLVSKNSPIVKPMLTSFERKGFTTTHFSDVKTPDGIKPVKATPVILLSRGRQIASMTGFVDQHGGDDSSLYRFYMAVMGLNKITPISKI